MTSAQFADGSSSSKVTVSAGTTDPYSRIWLAEFWIDAGSQALASLQLSGIRYVAESGAVSGVRLIDRLGWGIQFAQLQPGLIEVAGFRSGSGNGLTGRLHAFDLEFSVTSEFDNRLGFYVGFAQQAASVELSWTGSQPQLSTLVPAAINISDPPNWAPQGLLLIQGIARQGETLLAVSTLTDMDRLGVFSYEWLSNGATIPGANGSGLQLTQRLVGKAISVTVRYTDGQGTTEVVSSAATLPVQNVNDVPIASASSGSGPEDTPLNGSLAASDADGDSLRFLKVLDPIHGTVSVSESGAFTYTPALNFNGTDSFSFKASDGSLESAAATVTITVNAVNDAPVARDLSIDVNEDAAITSTLTASDIDSTQLVYAKSSDPAGGTVTVNTNGTFTYTPALNFNGTDSFSFKASDGALESAAATVTITVAPVNDAPVASALSLSTNEDATQTGALTATDIDSATLTYAKASNPANGTVTVNANGTFTYTPALNFNGTDSFTFKASDGALESVAATVTISVAPVNDAPVASPLIISTDEDSAKTGTLSASDIDSATLTYAKATDPTNGTVTVNADGTFTYTPSLNFNGSDSFSFRVNDGRIDSAPAVVSITVAPVNDVPVASALGVAINEDSTKSGFLSASDVDGDALSFLKVSDPLNGTVAVSSSGSYTYIPFSNYNGSDRFSFKVTDGVLDSLAVEVVFSVAPVNDIPIARSISFDLIEDQSRNGQLFALDADGDAIRFSLISGPAHGSIRLEATGAFVYAPEPDFNGIDSFDFRVSDAQSNSIPVRASLRVTPENDAPKSAPVRIELSEDSSISGSLVATDPDGDVLIYALVANAANGSVALSAGGSYTYIPNLNFQGVDSFSFAVSDGQVSSEPVTVAVKVTSVNDPPVAAPLSLDVAEDSSRTDRLIASDADGDSITFAKVSDPQFGAVTISDSGIYTYVPARNFTGADVFTFKVNDGSLESAAATVTITVAPVNDAPVASALSLSTDEDATQTGTLTATDTDSATLTYAKVSDPINGKVTVNADGTFTYTPAVNFNGTDSFSFKASDGALESAAATVTIIVAPVNDAPVASALSLSTNEDAPQTGTLTATDIDSATLTYAKASNPVNGTVTVNADGTFSYTPALNFNGTDSFTFKASDGSLESAVAAVTITVNAVNDAPVASELSLSTNEDATQTGTLTATDIDSATLTYARASNPANGTVTVNANGTFTYTPALNFNGTDSFTFKASDGSLESAVAAVTITVSAANDAPVANTLTISTNEDITQTGTLTATDIDTATLTYAKASDPTNGTVTVNANGTFIYTPTPNFNGADSFTFKVSDGFLESAPATVTITVSAVNDAPVANTLTISTNEDITQTGTLTATDIDSATLTYAKASDPINGTVTVNANGTFTYTPALNFNGTDSFTFKATDGSLESAAATVTITVNAVNDPATGTLLITGAPGQGLTLQANLASFSDVDGAPSPSQAIRYEWRADNTVIANVSGPDLFLAPALTGKSITVRAHFKDGLGTDEFVASSPSGPVLPGSISGEVRYWHGNEPVAATQIRVLDADSVASSVDPLAQASSTADGRWSVPQLDFDTFAVKASRAASATDHSSVSAADVLAALKLSVGRTPNADPDGPGPVAAPAAAPYQTIASDVTRDGFVRSDDAMLIMRAALKPASSPIWHWSFIAEGQGVSAVSRHATFTEPPPSVSVVNGTTSNWIGILLGDVDGSWNPGVLG